MITRAIDATLIDDFIEKTRQFFTPAMQQIWELLCRKGPCSRHELEKLSGGTEPHVYLDTLVHFGLITKTKSEARLDRNGRPLFMYDISGAIPTEPVRWPRYGSENRQSKKTKLPPKLADKFPEVRSRIVDICKLVDQPSERIRINALRIDLFSLRDFIDSIKDLQ